MDLARVREKVLAESYPSEDEFRDLNRLYSRISDFVQSEYGYETFFAGSAGRGTCVSGDMDIDVFVLFPENVDRSDLEDEGLLIGKSVFGEFDGEFEVEYAEHPYTKGVIEGREVEVVPCFDTSPSDIESAVDRSPYHAEWVNENLSDDQKKDVVVLKSFLKTQDLYGSSLRSRGFSGYLCEIMIACCGSFENLVYEASNWEASKIIDVQNYYDELPDYLVEKFSESSLKVVDPVDSERNVASVLTSENYAKFVYACWRLSENPGMKFFDSGERELDRFRLEQEIDRRADFVVIEFNSIDDPDDIVYPQMRKSVRRFKSVLESHGFDLHKSGFHVGQKIRVFFELSPVSRRVEMKEGPKVFHNSNHVSEFTSKYGNTFVQGERLFAKVEREYVHPKDLLKDFVDDSESDLGSKGFPDSVAEKLTSVRFVGPMLDDEEWLKFLYNSLRLEQ